MTENLYYLFVSGMILSSGPCLVSCAPFLIAYVAGRRSGVRDSCLSYLIFSLFKLLAYLFWGGICALGSSLIHMEKLLAYKAWIHGALGIVIAGVGIGMLIDRPENKTLCSCLCRFHVTNIALFGFLIGFAPCLPLLGILNYVVIISKAPVDAFLYMFVFGLGTVISPLFVLVVFSGSFAKVLSGHQGVGMIVRYVCGGFLVFLGGRILLSVFMLAR